MICEATISREPLAGLLESGLEKLLYEHWAEVAHDKEIICLKPNWERYFALEQMGEFVSFSARRGDDLLGYNGFFIPRSMHYADHILATNDVIFLRKGARGTLGIEMILDAEKRLGEMGATKIFYHTKADAILGGAHDSLDALDDLLEIEDRYGIQFPREAQAGTTLAGVLAHLGYSHIENLMGKRIKESS